jgi:hypothetical protein
MNYQRLYLLLSILKIDDGYPYWDIKDIRKVFKDLNVMAYDDEYLHSF